MKNILAVIPARLHSTRLPAKPLVKLDGKTMIQWVYEIVNKVDGISDVVIATDHDVIVKEVKSFGANVMMTSIKHESGTDRIGEVIEAFPNAEVIVNVQGDQPFIKTDIIDNLIEPFILGDAPDIVTIASPLLPERRSDLNTVKVVLNDYKRALYFTRAPIPHFRIEITEVPVFQHIGLYAYKRMSLEKFVSMPTSSLEQAEGLEQMRALQAAMYMHVSHYNIPSLEVNTVEDLKRAKELGLINQYELYENEGVHL